MANQTKTALRGLEKRAKESRRSNLLLIGRIKKKKVRNIDKVVHAAHKEAFSVIDCTQCANCCKKGTPSFTQYDVSRLASHLKLSNADFRKKYLQKDDEGDIIFKKTPCVFLGKDNRCGVYSARPRDCRAYPHTNHKNYLRNLDSVGLENTSICPAIYRVFERLKEIY